MDVVIEDIFALLSANAEERDAENFVQMLICATLSGFALT